MNIGVIFAGGVGSRMHSKEKPKQFLDMFGKPIIIHTVEHFEANPQIDAVVIACVEPWIDTLRDLVKTYKLTKVKRIVPGGSTGQLSIYNGLLAAEEIAGDEADSAIVLIHDGVRPLISSELISRNVEDVRRFGSSITGGIVKETIVEIDEGGSVVLVPDRARSRVAKAPQCFYLKDILAVHRKALDEDKTDYIDSCTIMTRYGYTLHMTDGPYENIKITTPDDFYTMRAILQVKEDAQIYGIDTEN